ncbi:hypothetical protein [Actinoallomurus sp. NPDC050550]|uniref:hypothetical protein n=1 Tax=Actinoallomurus sp. NPDC050550 TaxID=3154937 RepID=UPI0033F3162E
MAQTEATRRFYNDTAVLDLATITYPGPAVPTITTPAVTLLPRDTGTRVRRPATAVEDATGIRPASDRPRGGAAGLIRVLWRGRREKKGSFDESPDQN